LIDERLAGDGEIDGDADEHAHGEDADDHPPEEGRVAGF
jgi:hypothetical protein